MEQVYVKTRAEWRNWLKRYYDRNAGIWLLFYKKHTGKPTLEYEEAVEEALCFGWIDSIIKKVDEERYVRKFTPRKADSRWSKLNKKRVTKLIKQGMMTEFGLAIIEQAKKEGFWSQSDIPHIPFEIPRELKEALRKNKKAKLFFDKLAPTYQKQFIGWVYSAKRQETKDRRVRESIALLKEGKKLGMK